MKPTLNLDFLFGHITKYYLSTDQDICCLIQIVKINNSIRSGRVRFRNFPGATLGELLRYMNPILTEENYDTAVVHVGINDMC